MLLDAELSQLVLVDYQPRLMPAIFEGSLVLANAVTLAQMARLLQVPVVGTEQNPSKLGENAPEIRSLCQRTLAKMQFSGVEEGLGEWLRPPVKPVAGNARSLPKHLQKPSNTPTERNRDAAFDRLAGAGAELVTTEMVAFEWLRSAEHPQFKALQSLIK